MFAQLVNKFHARHILPRPLAPQPPSPRRPPLERGRIDYAVDARSHSSFGLRTTPRGLMDRSRATADGQGSRSLCTRSATALRAGFARSPIFPMFEGKRAPRGSARARKRQTSQLRRRAARQGYRLAPVLFILTIISARSTFSYECSPGSPQTAVVATLRVF